MNKITEITGLTQIDFLKKWADTLESGKIERTTERLKGKGENGVVGMCCLGVACDILSQHGYGTWQDITKWASNFSIGDDDIVYCSMPPTEIQRFIQNGTSLNCDDLAGKNDNGRTFKKTAAVIRTAIKSLEKQK